MAIWRRLGLTRRAAIVEMNLGAQSYSAGRWDEAVSWYGQARDSFGRAGDSTQTALAEANLGELLIGRGDYEGGEKTLRDARRALRAANHATGAIFAETQLGRLMVLKGDEGALEALRMVTTEAAARSNAYLLLEASVQLAAGEVLLGDPEDGLRVLAEARQGAGHEIAYFAAAMGRVAALAQVALGHSTTPGRLSRPL